MSQFICDLVEKDLRDRSTWEERQRLFYEMRHNGLRRKNKPFPAAADLHYPLADSQIDKLKPFYFSQIWGNEVLASFISKRNQTLEDTQSAAGWFTYHMVQHTNFFDESLCAIDNMLNAGNTLLWLRWDPTEKALVFDAIDPVFCVLPQNTRDIQRAPRVTKILHHTPQSYARRDDWNQDPDFIKDITGQDTKKPSKVDAKYSREGLTQGEDSDQIVIWETWTNTKDGWRVFTYSPMQPETPVKPSYLCTYEMDGRSFLPAVDLPVEIKDKGYYAPRGIPEKVGAFEAYLCRTWNEKADAMTFLNRPIFTHEGESINLNNVRLKPGDIVGKNLQAVQMPPVPISFDMEMQNTRAAAEDITQMPDYGMSKKNSSRDPRTATEIQAVGALFGMSTDLRARIFRSRMGRLYRMAWSLLRTYKKDDLSFYFEDQMQQSPAEALHDSYLIEPDGSPDSWNKPQRVQRAQTRYQLLRGSPYVNQGELTKNLIEEDDAHLVRRLYQDPQVEQARQQEDQAQELSILAMGFPAAVMPADDDAIHLQTVAQYLEMKIRTGQPITAIEAQRDTEHAQAHLAQMKQRNPKQFKIFAPQMQRLAQAVQAYMPPPAAPAGPPQPGTASPTGPMGPAQITQFPGAPGGAPGGMPQLTAGQPAATAAMAAGGI